MEMVFVSMAESLLVSRHVPYFATNFGRQGAELNPSFHVNGSSMMRLNSAAVLHACQPLNLTHHAARELLQRAQSVRFRRSP